MSLTAECYFFKSPLGYPILIDTITMLLTLILAGSNLLWNFYEI
jgi:hypothetical protein